MSLVLCMGCTTCDSPPPALSVFAPLLTTISTFTKELTTASFPYRKDASPLYSRARTSAIRKSGSFFQACMIVNTCIIAVRPCLSPPPRQSPTVVWTILEWYSSETTDIVK